RWDRGRPWRGVGRGRRQAPAAGRRAKQVSAAADAGDYTRYQVPCLGMRRRPKRQGVQAGYRPRTHREHVAQNATDPGRRALVGLDIAWMIVALHLEHAGEAITDVDDARLLARPLDHPWALCGQRAQMDLGRLVRAVLVPHR